MNRIILDCDLMRHPNSGLYHYCLNLGNYINRQLDPAREQLSLYAPGSVKTTFHSPASVIVEKKWHRLAKPFLKKKTVWHAPFQSGRILPNRQKHPSVKVLLTIHDLNPLHEGKTQQQQRKSLAHTQSLINNSDAVVCISEFCKADVLKNCHTGRKPVYVVHNGTHQVHAPKLQETSYQPVRPFLFGLGYVNRKKNFHVLLPLLGDENLELVIAGRPDEQNYIDEMLLQAKELGVADRFHLLGPISEAEKAWYFEHCLAYVHPSLAEGFGAPVVEAMQFGKPLFLSALTSLPEIGGDCAFYFSSFDPYHMRDVFYAGLEQYQKEDMADRIRQRGRQFDWNEKAADYLSIYRQLFES